MAYPEQIEKAMQRYYLSLSEKDRRRYAAIEALKLGRGGIAYIARLLGCDPRTISSGLKEVVSENPLSQGRIRIEGAGRKTAWETYPDLDRQFLLAIAPHQVRRNGHHSIVFLSRKEVRLALAERGITVSFTVIDQLLKKHKVIRKAPETERAIAQTI